jgi:glycerophosphoryl diester phosphodiesterase
VATRRLAHRGDWRAAPENSLAAMQAALRMPGVDGLELDVRASADGVAVLAHDARLDRLQGLAAAVAELPAAELGALGLSTLAEVLAGVGLAPFLDVELKEIVPAAIDVLDAGRGVLGEGRGGPLRRTVVSAFEPATLAWLAEQRPVWTRWLNAMDLDDRTLDTAAALGCAAVSASWAAIDERSVGRARERGLEVAAWTVRDRGTYRRLESLGVAAICAEAEALDG